MLNLPKNMRYVVSFFSFYYIIFLLFGWAVKRSPFLVPFFLSFIYAANMCSLASQHSSSFIFLFIFYYLAKYKSITCSKPNIQTPYFFFFFLQRASRWNIIKRQRHNGWFTDYFASKCGNRPLGKSKHFIYDYCSLFVSYRENKWKTKTKETKNKEKTVKKTDSARRDCSFPPKHFWRKKATTEKSPQKSA